MKISNALLNLPSFEESVIQIGRNAAAIAAAASTTSTSTTTTTTTSSSSSYDSLTNTSLPRGGSESSSFLSTPEAHATLLMATSMALHYFSYSLARPTTLSLFTSSKTGFAHPSAFPFAMAFISPTSLLLLLAYGRELEEGGPKVTLLRTSLFCGGVLAMAASLISHLDKQSSQILFPRSSIPLVKIVSAVLFIFRESYVQLITSQMWSFMVSVLTPAQSAQWFAPICGLTSLSSALAGMGVGRLSSGSGVGGLGLTGVLVLAGGVLWASALVGQKAYSLAEMHGFDPSKEHIKNKKKVSSSSSSSSEGMIKKATSLFQRVPTLGALFCEILAVQGLSTLLNVCFVTKLKESIPDDSLRAGWMGKFFALINVISSALQFFVLPPLMTKIEPSWVWRTLPLIMLCLTSNQAVRKNPSLYLVSGSLLTLKALEFSARRMLDEMVYVPLDFESRYVGKEVIGVFGYRFGKSGTSLLLSGLTSLFGNFGIQQLSCLTTGSAVVWTLCAWRLSYFVPSKKEAEEIYVKNKEDAEKKEKCGKGGKNKK